MTEPTDRAIEPDIPLSNDATARIAYALAAVEVSDYTAAVVPTFSDGLAEPGEFITQARQARKLALVLLTRAVLLERSRGHSWKQIAASYGQAEEWVRAKYEPIEQEWIESLKGIHRPTIETIEMAALLPNTPTGEAEIRETAMRLDEWCRSRPGLGIPTDQQRPVSDGLVQR